MEALKNSVNVFLCIFVLISQIAAVASVQAYEWKNIRFKVRTHQLPEFCLCAGHPPPACSSKAKRKQYLKFYGPIFNHLHHYCWGLDKLNKQLQSGKPSKFWLKNVIHEFDYVLGHKDPKRRMKAEIFTKKAQVLLMIHKNVEAIKSFSNAIRFNKKYVPAYYYLSNYLIRIGDRGGACKIIKLGIKYNPNSKILKKQYSAICKTQ